MAVDDAINAAAAAGVHNAIAAMNENGRDACTMSPAGAAQGYTVAAADNTDGPASFTNIGGCVDIWGPGVNIMAPYIGSNTATRSMSGTSMATPHVVGVMALLIAERGDMPPADLAAAVNALGTEDVIRFPAKKPQHVVPVRRNHSHAHRRRCSSDADCGFQGQCCPGTPESGRFCTNFGAPLETCCGRDVCTMNSDCCSVGGAPSHCNQGMFEACCAGSTCHDNPYGGGRDICCNPD